MENFNLYTNEIIIDYEFNLKQGNNKEILLEFPKLINQLNNCFKKDSQNFAELCFLVSKLEYLFNHYTFRRIYLKSSKSEKYPMGYTFDSVMRGFGLDASQVSRLLSCYKKFVTLVEEKPIIKAEFFAFNKSKLFELLVVDDEQLQLDIKNKVLRSDMSVLIIREYIKNYKSVKKANAKIGEEKEEKIVINEDEIPMAYDPKQHYDFDYFETKTKSQLLNIVWDLQKYCEKLKKEKK